MSTPTLPYQPAESLALAGRFPEIRGQLRDEYWHSSDADIEAWVPQTFQGLTAEELESFLRSLRSFGKSAGQTLTKAAPGMLSGAVQGASLGMAAGPYGALIGAGIGAVGGGVAQLATPAPTAGQQPPPGAGQPAPAAPAAPAAPPPPSVRPAQRHAPPIPTPTTRSVTPPPTTGAPGGSAAAGHVAGQAAATLLQFLSQPQVLQAITSLAMSGAGRETVVFGNLEHRTVDVLAELSRLTTVALHESLVPSSLASASFTQEAIA